MNARPVARRAGQSTVNKVLDDPEHSGRRKGSCTVVDSARIAAGAARPRVSITHGDALAAYSKWKPPIVIISDGPYGLGMFDGDPDGADGLAEFYEPHVIQWARHSTNQTTLWFWCTEVGWATVHPVLERHGWRYTNCHVWNKGIGHIAGNVNTRTIRKFPVVTEVCVQYVMDKGVSGVPIKDWLRAEWGRTGLPLFKTNEACGLKNAATRKYFARDRMWYMPPPKEFEKISRYANRHGGRSGRPYFSLDGVSPAGSGEWSKMRAKFKCPMGVTNVWDEPPLHGEERIKNGSISVHCNQKPMSITRLIIESSSDPGDVVWEPFGGLCTAAVASALLGRWCYSAEIDREFYDRAAGRLSDECHGFGFGRRRAGSRAGALRGVDGRPLRRRPNSKGVQ